MKIQFVSADDWTAMYIDGKLAIDGHSLHYTHVLKALGIIYDDAIEIECNDETHWIDFAKNIEDVKVHAYGDTP